jgi:LysR family transcriptional regulator for metE and metH
VEGLQRRYPTFKLHIAAEYTLDPVAALLDAKLDLAIMNDDSDDKRLRYRELFEDEHVAVVPPSHRWTTRPFVTAEELAAERLYLYSRSIDHSFIVQKVLRPAGAEPCQATYLQLTEGIIEMVKAGLGASVLPRWSIATALAAKGVKAVRITRAGVFRKWYAATLGDTAATPIVEEFIRLLIKQGPGAKRPAAASVRPRKAASKITSPLLT